MQKPSLCITICLVGCLLSTSTSMSSVLLTPPYAVAETITEGEDQATDVTVISEDEESPEIEPTNCTFKELLPEDVVPIGTRGKLLVISSNLTLSLSQPYVFDPDKNVCYKRGKKVNEQIFKACLKWEYKEEDNEFSVQEDRTVLLYGDVLEPGSYSIQNGRLDTCLPEEFYEDSNSTGDFPAQNSNLDNVSIIVGQVLCGISIVALTAHLVSFCLVPAMRTLPGYNLASLSGAFLLGYLFSLIGQIPQVLGFFCVLCGVLVQYFLLAAFFCMNTLAFDVWRTLKMATTKLVMSSQNAKRRQFLYYSIYSWGVPLVITIISVIMDNIRATPNWIRPDFGMHDICWMANEKAKLAFFMIPAFVLFSANTLFFVLSAFIIKTNTMEATSDEERQMARHNFVLYFRLGIMMGVTWLMNAVGTLVDNYYFWLASDIMNSLQGLFVFLMFTCSKRVIDHVRDKMQLAATLKTPKTSTSDLTSRKISASDGPPVKRFSLSP
ncbi:hypothetical protein JTE90_016125 [Oedothorax gibbosus]|uniref:G-protein coupled receptors family 2 profile 2 domain-containing protein n=1 Tax=Oedothorax gibbosus TaxID=931172 RepID=A0AAV6U7H5_9ARAC|nr:hypothetical protein JTE90_016125 [Oedothorax gibbosus]